MYKPLFLLAGVTLAVGTALAQQGSNATLNGIVKDPTGAVIPGAEVTAMDSAKGVATHTTTTGTGVFTFPNLPPGLYKLSAEHAGFRPNELLNVPLRVAQLLSVNLTLQVGAGTETVTVSGDAQLLETSTAQISHYVTAKEMLTWPIPVTNDGERQLQSFIFQSLPGTTGETFLGSINGGQYFSNEVYIDGISMGTPDTAELGPSVDAVGEFNLQTGSMGAQYNGGGTAVSNFDIHSGTNHLHGSVYEYLQNEDLNANSFDDKAVGGTPLIPKQRLNNFGVSIGGPVYIPKVYNGHDKTFFFFSYEGTRKDSFQYEGKTTMPTQGMLAGDLSGFLNPAMTEDSQSGQQAMANGAPVTDAEGRPVIFGQIYDPATTRLVQAGQTDPVTGRTVLTTSLVRDPFPNNQIPAARFNSVAANYLKLKFPTNFINDQVVQNLPVYAANQPVFSQNDYSFKIDEHISQAHMVSFYMTTTQRSRQQTANSAWSLPGTNPLDTWYTQSTPGKIIRANEYWTITPRLVNHLGIGYNRFNNFDNSAFQNQNWAQQLGMPNLPDYAFPTVAFSQTPTVTGNPSLGNGIDQFGTGADGSGSVEQSTIYTDQISFTHGSHQLQFGTEGRFYNENDVNKSSQAGYTFSNTDTDDGLATTLYTGNSFASFLLGQVNSTSRSIVPGTFGFRRREFGTFIQDNWKVNSRFSLNLGLRWSVLTGITEVRGRMTSFEPTLPNAAAGNLPGALAFASALNKNGFENTDWGLILPRFGFAYELNPRMVMRGGFGVNSQAPEAGPELQFQGDPSTLGYTGTLQVNQNSNPQPYSDIAAFTLGQPYPSFTQALPDTDPTQANLGGQENPPPYIIPGGARDAYVENYSFGFQFDMGHKTIGEMNYIGNTSRRLNAAYTDQLNQLPLSDLAYGDALLDPLSEFPNIPTPYPGFNSSYTVQQALAPFPQYPGGGIAEYDSHRGWSRYDSLQATLTRHIGTGLSFVIAYTWSKTMTNTNSNCNSGTCTPVQNVYDLGLEKAIALGIDVPQQGKITAIYDLPVGRGRQFHLPALLDLPFGGWTISGNAIYQSGDALAISDSGVNNGIFASTRPNYTGQIVKVDQPGMFNYIHPAAGPDFLNPAAFTHVPTSPVNQVALTTGNVPSALGHDFGPGLADENFSLQKDFAFGETRYLQFRADAFNAFNRAGRGNPVTDINNPLFGKITEPGTDSQSLDADSYFYQPRVVQVSARIQF